MFFILLEKGLKGGFRGWSLQEESVHGEEVGVHPDAAAVAQNLEDAAASHTDEEAPGLLAEAEDALGEEKEGEDDEVDGVTGEGGDVVDETLRGAAGFEGALFVGDGVVALGGHCGGCLCCLCWRK